MRRSILAASVLACFLTLPAAAQVSINFGGPGVHIGLDLPVYPTLQRVPGYPVYYAPNVNSNYFFYDGLYWVYDDDNWYSSSWYNGPWHTVDPYYVPSYVLRVPVRYYRSAPTYFRSWRADAPPRWHEHWGASWSDRRSGWDRWDRRSAPAPAPLPAYQRQYSGDRYPQVRQQVTIQTQSYRYQPREQVTQQHFQQRRLQVQVAAPRTEVWQQQAPQRQPEFRQQASQSQQRAQALPPVLVPQPMGQRQGLPQPMGPSGQSGLAPREQSLPATQPEGRGPGNVPGRREDRDEDRGRGHDRGDERGKGHDRGEERGKGHDRGEERGKGRGRD